MTERIEGTRLKSKRLQLPKHALMRSIFHEEMTDVQAVMSTVGLCFIHVGKTERQT